MEHDSPLHTGYRYPPTRTTYVIYARIRIRTICIHTCIHTHTYVYNYTHIYIYIYIYIYYNLSHKYDTEQRIYLQSKIDEIKIAVSNKKSAMVWKAVNDVIGRKLAIKLR